MSLNKQIDSEKLLYKLILQFAIYNRGSNTSLDPYLTQISQSLKKGASFQQLNPGLISLSKALSHISHIKENSSNDSTTQEAQSYFINKLLKLFEETEIPLEFHTQVTQLHRKGKQALTDHSYKGFVDTALSLLLKIKDNALFEKRNLEVYLADIPQLLSSLKEQSLFVSQSNDLSIENRENLSNQIDLQVDNIKNSSADATDLSLLKESINLHLQELSSTLHSHNDEEDSRQIEIQKQLQLMSSKLHEMEVETEALRSNLKAANDKAFRDSLTGLPNRLAYDERVALEYNRWHRYKTPLSLLVWDIDLFKLINDNYGHKAGDKTLALVAQIIQKHCRNTDFVARYGGEEFVMIMPNTTSREALIPADKIRNFIAGSRFNHHGESIKLSISCGISQFSEDDMHESVFERADQALYMSKEQGRNRCSILEKSPEKLNSSSSTS